MELSRKTLSTVPVSARPRIDAPAAGIVHLGLGAFHRAHQAVFTEDAMAAAGGGWGIVGVAPRSPQVVEAMRAQDGLFSVTTLGPGGRGTRVIGSSAGQLRAAAGPDAVVARIADPAIKIVTLTVTEKGYKLDAATGRLLLDDELRADLETGRPPQTVPGLLIRGLCARRRADAGPIALASCDNLPANGHRLRGLIETLAAATAIGDWVRESVTFPGSMVDRIVPATTPAFSAMAAEALGVRDRAAVCGEPYSAWVIEDDFPAGRPAWEQAGAVMTDDPRPYERLKLRTLNGVHSAIAYLGALAGHTTIDSALRMPGLRPVVREYIASDVAPSFAPPSGVDTVAYGEEVLTRFENPAIAYRTVQVATDGSQKLPQRVLQTIQDRRAAGAMPRWGALIVAAWMRFVQGVADDGQPLPLDDPLADRIRARLAAAPTTPEGVVDALLGLDTVFTPALADDVELRAVLVEWLTALQKHGVAATLAGVA
ncbi:mannitol dehydrogenase family protein [Paractinoplanes brasiliensis]|uniref:Mannitol-1-phosphate 5-dehydrogenase n=1 Tax=Paractinoplanes brasiliensis TaxID=52695 RepID=A0A4R6K4U1_9ACTN|nr:mannitol dehydrogenase family protein [Actinoplanes brasiliensis]TDO42245.1 fructuronate reductase [Actinoplanes brasiliensis]GID29473.1 mannitol dehydrogenase [Actinoplanes brasiliensis]